MPYQCPPVPHHIISSMGPNSSGDALVILRFIAGSACGIIAGFGKGRVGRPRIPWYSLSVDDSVSGVPPRILPLLLMVRLVCDEQTLMRSRFYPLLNHAHIISTELPTCVTDGRLPSFASLSERPYTGVDIRPTRVGLVSLLPSCRSLSVIDVPQCLALEWIVCYTCTNTGMAEGSWSLAKGERFVNSRCILTPHRRTRHVFRYPCVFVCVTFVTYQPGQSSHRSSVVRS